MPVRRKDAQRALVLLEAYQTKLSQTDDRQLKHSIQRVIDIFQSNLFQALIDIQEFYEVTLLDSQKCADPARSWEPLPPVNLWDLSSLQSPTGTSETLPSISTSIEKYRHHDEDASPQEPGSPQLMDEAPGPELVQVAEKSLSQIENVHGYVAHAHISPMKVASLESIFEGSSLLGGQQDLASLPPSPRPLGSPLPSTSSNPYPPESPLPFCSSNPYPSQLLIQQAEGALPPSPIIPVVPVSPVPAESSTHQPPQVHLLLIGTTARLHDVLTACPPVSPLLLSPPPLSSPPAPLSSSSLFASCSSLLLLSLRLLLLSPLLSSSIVTSTLFSPPVLLSSLSLLVSSFFSCFLSSLSPPLPSFSSFSPLVHVFRSSIFPFSLIISWTTIFSSLFFFIIPSAPPLLIPF